MITAASFRMYNRRKPVFVEDNKAISTVSGHITEVHFPVQLDLFSGYAAVTIDGRKVAGTFPFLDFNFKYTFLCTRKSTVYGVEYTIKGPGNPAYIPLPLSMPRLKMILCSELGFSDGMASHLVHTIETDERLRDLDFTNVDVRKMINLLAPTPDWLGRLVNQSLYFRYPFMQMLFKFWSHQDLKQFDVEKLMALARAFEENPENFCYSWMNDFSLPELNREQVARAYASLGREPDAFLLSRVTTYTNMKSAVDKSKSIAVPWEKVMEWGSENWRSALARKVIKIYPAPETKLVFISKDWHDLQFICNTLARLMSQVPKKKLWLKKTPSQYRDLTPSQREIVDGSKMLPFLIIRGGGGVGKTFTSKTIVDLSSKKLIQTSAAFGRVAATNRIKFGKACTIHRAHRLYTLRTKGAVKDSTSIKRNLIDEGSHLTVKTLAMIMECYPITEQLIIVGDEAQMRPPGPGAIFESLIDFYSGTPIVKTLTEIMRVNRDDEDRALIMINNASMIRDGKTNLHFCRQIKNGSSPLVVLARRPVTADMWADENRRGDRIAQMKESLRPVVEALKYEDYQIVTQTHKVGLDLNAAIGLLYDSLDPEHGTSKIFKVGSKIMHKQNFYPQEIPVPRGAAKKAMFLRSLEWILRTSQVNRGEVDVIREILDYDINAATWTPVLNTAAPKARPAIVRIIKFASGAQQNLSTLSLSNMERGDVSTNAGSQGMEYPWTVLYLDENDLGMNSKYGPRVDQNEFYTVATRSKVGFVVICSAPYDSLDHSDIAKVINTKRPALTQIAHTWFPKYVEPTEEQLRAAEVYEDSDEEESEDDTGED